MTIRAAGIFAHSSAPINGVNYANIYLNKNPPNFQNTIEQIEKAEELLDKVCRVFFNLTGTDSNIERQNIQLKIAPQLAQFSSEVLMNSRLWLRVKEIFNNRDDQLNVFT